MANLFFRTCVSPYRIDTYNTLHDDMDFELYFLGDEDDSQSFDMKRIYGQCHFTPHILKTVSILRAHFQYCPEIWSIIKRNNPSVVIVPEYKILTVQVLLYKWLHRAKFRVVSMCDDSYDMVSNDNDFSATHKWARKIVVPWLDDLLLVDNKVVEWYQERYKKGYWLPIVRDEEKETKAYEQAVTISHQYQEQFDLKGRKILLYVGRLVALKNLERVIRAINRCQTDFTFVIIGDGEERSKLEEAASQCNHRVLLGGRYEEERLRAWYNIADVFILASYQEAYGAVTNEALLAGCRCAISSHCGSACLIDDRNGATFNPYDEEEIASQIDALISKSPQRETCAARAPLMSFSFRELMNGLKQRLNL